MDAYWILETLDAMTLNICLGNVWIKKETQITGYSTARKSTDYQEIIYHVSI